MTDYESRRRRHQALQASYTRQSSTELMSQIQTEFDELLAAHDRFGLENLIPAIVNLLDRTARGTAPNDEGETVDVEKLKALYLRSAYEAYVAFTGKSPQAVITELADRRSPLTDHFTLEEITQAFEGFSKSGD